MDEIYESRLKQLFYNANTFGKSNIQLVFINACYSFSIAELFANSKKMSETDSMKIPYVIAVQSDLKINDEFALNFSEEFYKWLLQSHNIKEAFRHAQITTTTKISNDSLYTCCCSHSHDGNCFWLQTAFTDGYPSAHKSHTPTCFCKEKKKHYHDINCPWVLDFFDKFSINPEERKIKLNDTTEGYFCCCCLGKDSSRQKIDDSIKDCLHNENLKFQLLIGDNAPQKLEATDSVKEIIYKGNSLWHVIFPEIINQPFYSFNAKKISQLRFMMQTIVTCTTNSLIQVYADTAAEGYGRTFLAKSAANYLSERKCFNRILYVDIKITNNYIRFKNKIKEIKKLYQESQLTLLLIFDNCDELYYKSPEKFLKKIKELQNLPSTSISRYLKIILIVKKEIPEISKGNCKPVKIEKFGFPDCANFFYNSVLNTLPSDRDDIFQPFMDPEVYDLKLTPKEILELVGLYNGVTYITSKNQKCREKIQMILDGEKHRSEVFSEFSVQREELR